MLQLNMALIYDESTQGKFTGFNPAKCNATKVYMTHYANSLYLKFMLAKGNRIERYQAVKELAICDRKLLYWQRQSNFNETQAEQLMIEEKKKWI